MCRPQKSINWNEVEKRMEMGFNGIQIAACMRIDAETFYTRFKDHFGETFQSYSTRFPKCCIENVLFMQYVKAMNGSVEMLKLLGREWAGQGRDEDPEKRILADKFEVTLKNWIKTFSDGQAKEINEVLAKEQKENGFSLKEMEKTFYESKSKQNDIIEENKPQ